ncbi:MAG: TlpA disulfide reductase family protein [Propionicimonas sp.]|uniref:TlpA family protein disulfide reductase n=1 Tax=Propionibacteriales TaxID=85009 RepID=UPI0009898911|nr:MULTISPECIES: TlpA disulfide reductase family protein [Propionibacteriales]MEA4945692.1 TlpA disulfide reductase family protein [Propionicimonas sp.]MEA5118978.1 TlpA disulfide reductase family protein [Propionicimonas sp.]WOQ18864.1 TlpA disulfide reductase family protein [Raineyella sp. W15-4]HAM45012.1 TlpA family protein disulfide reductase [Propionibacteriaceae bacterium]
MGSLPHTVRRRLWSAAVAIASGVLLAGCGSTQANTGGFVSGDGSLTVLPADERPQAPVIEGVTLDDERWTSADVSGKVIVYNVWGSWCAPCRSEAPALVAASQKLADQAVFVGLNTRDFDKAAPRAFVRAFEVPYVNLFDPEGALLLNFSGELPPNAIPSTIVVDLEGRVAARIIGETTESTLVGLIQDVAAGK